MATIAETNVERGAFICSRCDRQTMKLIDCMCEPCHRSVREPKVGDVVSAEEAREMFVAPDLVNHPPHYTAHPSGIECIQITEHMGFCLGNAFKYIWRADLKADAIEDLKKAVWYIQREIEKREK